MKLYVHFSQEEQSLLISTNYDLREPGIGFGVKGLKDYGTLAEGKITPHDLSQHIEEMLAKIPEILLVCIEKGGIINTSISHDYEYVRSFDIKLPPVMENWINQILSELSDKPAPTRH